jgi:hypothetical protein
VSFGEKSNWAILGVAIVVPSFYFAHILAALRDTPVADIAFVRPLITSFVIFVVSALSLHIIASLSNPREKDKRDVRDKEIDRFGEYVGGIVMGIGAMTALAQVLAGLEDLWVASTLYGTFVSQALVSAVIKIVLYRRGMP